MNEQSCPICRNTVLTVHSEKRMIRASDQAELPYAAQYTHCEACGEEFLTRVQSRAASRAATGALRKHQGLLGPDQIIAIRAQYGVTQIQLETILNLGKKSIVRWESGAVCQSRAADQLLREVRESPALFHKLAQRAGVSVPAMFVPEPMFDWGNLIPITANFVATTNTIGASARQRDAPRTNIPSAAEFDSFATAEEPSIIGASVGQDIGSTSPALLTLIEV